jgi:hypothetical protein
MGTSIVGSDIPSGNEVTWYYGGTQITAEALTEVAGVITLSKTAEYGSVFVVDSLGDPTTQMLELKSTGPDVEATEADGCAFVRTSTAGTDSVTAYYIDIDTTPLVELFACQDVASDMSMDTKVAEVHGQITKLKKTGATERTVTLTQLDYSDAFVGAIFGDYVSNSPATGDTKWNDNHQGVQKIGVLVGKQYVNNVLSKKWFLIGCQVSKIGSKFPTADYYAKDLEFLVDYVQFVQWA